MRPSKNPNREKYLVVWHDGRQFETLTYADGGVRIYASEPPNDEKIFTKVTEAVQWLVANPNRTALVTLELASSLLATS